MVDVISGVVVFGNGVMMFILVVVGMLILIFEEMFGDKILIICVMLNIFVVIGVGILVLVLNDFVFLG